MILITLVVGAAIGMSLLASVACFIVGGEDGRRNSATCFALGLLLAGVYVWATQ